MKNNSKKLASYLVAAMIITANTLPAAANAENIPESSETKQPFAFNETSDDKAPILKKIEEFQNDGGFDGLNSSNIIHGDFNNDGTIDADDAVTLQKYVLGAQNVERPKQFDGDLNCYGEVDVFYLVEYRQLLNPIHDEIHDEFDPSVYFPFSEDETINMPKEHIFENNSTYSDETTVKKETDVELKNGNIGTRYTITGDCMLKGDFAPDSEFIIDAENADDIKLVFDGFRCSDVNFIFHQYDSQKLDVIFTSSDDSELEFGKGSFERCLKDESGNWDDTDYSNIKYNDKWNINYYSYPKNLDFNNDYLVLNSNGGFLWFGIFQCPYLNFKADSASNREMIYTDESGVQTVFKPSLVGMALFRTADVPKDFFTACT